MTEVLVVGSLNTDLVAHADRLPQDGETVLGHTFQRAAGGKGLNQAVAAARAGARTAVIGAVGGDDLGRFLLGEARSAQLDLTGVRTVESSSGVALIEVSGDAANRIIVVPGANDFVNAALVSAQWDAVPAPRVVLCQQEIPTDGVRTALQNARRCGATTVLNPAPSRALPAELLDSVDWLIPNEHEALLLIGGSATLSPAEPESALAIARRLRELGPGAVVVTLGEHGSVAIDQDGVEYVVPAIRVPAVDTTAAGDSFCGAFAAALATGAAVPLALRRAAASGALATTRRGAVPSIPTAAEVDQLLATQ